MLIGAAIRWFRFYVQSRMPADVLAARRLASPAPRASAARRDASRTRLSTLGHRYAWVARRAPTRAARVPRTEPAPHSRHAGRAEFSAASVDRFAVCPTVEGALVRFLLRLGESAATAAVRPIHAMPSCESWADEISYADVDLDHVVGHRQVTDAYLVGLAGAARRHWPPWTRGLRTRFRTTQCCCRVPDGDGDFGGSLWIQRSPPHWMPRFVHAHASRSR